MYRKIYRQYLKSGTNANATRRYRLLDSYCDYGICTAKWVACLITINSGKSVNYGQSCTRHLAALNRDILKRTLSNPDNYTYTIERNPKQDERIIVQ